MCEHKNSKTQGSWVFCSDCGELLGESTCEHKNFEVEDSWVFCMDCGAARLAADEQWIFTNELL